MRHKPAPKRVIRPEYKYQSSLVAKFINHIMFDGKKSVASRLVYGAFDLIAAKTKQPPLEVFDLAIRNVAPVLEVKSNRLGGANYQVPIEVRGDRRITLSMRWIIDAARPKRGQTMDLNLAEELMAAARKEGSAIKKREDVHRMADANRAFAHFA